MDVAEVKDRNKKKIDTESFRDHISTVDKEGKRVWIYPKKSKGKLTSLRTYISWLFFALFFAIPFIKIEGEPIVLLNVMERKFIFFGSIFWPQDFHLLLIATLVFIVFIIVFTVAYGRVFCGWVCPQTIFMEMFFRKIEYWIEGDYKAQQALDKEKLNAKKIAKKSLKHFIFLAAAFIISNTFLMYIIGSGEWIKIATEPIENHLSGFISIIVFTGAFYAVYARFREQVCTTICPYGRLQGVLIDKKTIVVAYDYKRGDPKGTFRKNEDRALAGKGDCIDCNLCTVVCPTGMDIRNGTQLECINCTACIDACNYVMDEVNLPKGLIRFDSEEGIAKGERFKFTPRLLGYSAILLVLLTILVALLTTRTDIETTVLRTPGILYQELGKDKISNLYQFKIVNKTNKELTINLQPEDNTIELRMNGESLNLKKQAISDGSFFIIMSKGEIKSLKTKVHINVYSGDKLMETVKTTFIGPIQ